MALEVNIKKQFDYCEPHTHELGEQNSQRI